jgi:hypothetical protein
LEAPLASGCDSKFASILAGSQQQQQLQSLCLSSPDSLVKVINTLPLLTSSLKSLKFSQLSSALSFHALVAILPHLQLVELFLRCRAFDLSHSSFFLALTSQSKSLISLSLEGCSYLALSDVSSSLSELTNLTILSMDFCEFQPALDASSVRVFMAALRSLPIASLSLCSFVRSAEVLEEIVVALPSLSSSLQRLDLSNCLVGEDPKRAEQIWSNCFTAFSKCPNLHFFRAVSFPPLYCDLLTLLPQTHLSHLELRHSGFPVKQQTEIFKKVSSLFPSWKCNLVLSTP